MKGKVEKVTPKGLGLGLSAEKLFARELEERGIRYAEGDVFMFVTDGITEGQKSAGDEFGEDRLLRILKENSGKSALTIRDKVIEEVRKFSGETAQHDDQTVVVVKTGKIKSQKSKVKKTA
jgi:sigma-B regulation protein RsbU (phosphoserine phosphatase)